MSTPRVSIVVAIGNGLIHNRVIGKDNTLLWHIPDDLKRFRELTMGHPVIMGRKTFDSIAKIVGGPLPGRINIVLSWNPEWTPPEGVHKASSFKEALKMAQGFDSHEVFVIGGGQVYEEALPFVDRIYLTLIDDDQAGDSFFPPYEHLFKRKLSIERREHNGLQYQWIELER